MSKCVIRPIPVVRALYHKALMTYGLGFDDLTPMYIYLWYIDGLEKRVVVDTGATVENPRIATFPNVEKIQSVEEGLAKVGVEASEIDIVIITHLHHDHIELASKFPQAKFVVQKAELEEALNPHPLFAAGYVKHHFTNLNFEVLDGDSVIMPGVSVLLTPGHTPGGQSVVVETTKGKAIITGFCCIDDNFLAPVGGENQLPFVIPGIFIDARQIYNSMMKVKQLADIIIPLHSAQAAKADKIPS